MQRKGNAIRSESQVKNQISVGIDMGGSLWATAVQDWEAGTVSGQQPFRTGKREK